MKKLYKLLFVVLFGFSCFSCQSEREEYYERPAWLEETLYDQLKSSGNYNEYLKCLDRTGYGEILSRSGSYTIFAPTDEAFMEFYSQNSMDGIEDMPIDKCRELVEYLMLNYAYSKSQLLEWSSFEYNWRNDSRAFKKRTLLKRYYRADDKKIASERKYIPLFSNQYFDYRTASTSGMSYDKGCYEYFYPGVEWEGMNLDGARFVETEVPAENGFFYGIDRVITPLDNLMESIANGDSFSEFNSIMNLFVAYTESPSETALAGGGETVYKRRLSLVANLFAEELMGSDHSSFNVFALAAPNNQAFNDYVANRVFSRGYTSKEQVPLVTWEYILNAHIKLAGAGASYYPVDLKKETSQWAEIDYFSGSDVFYKKFTSNGPLYGISRVLESPVIKSVVSKAFFDPDYSMFINAMEVSGNLSLMGIDEYTVVGLKNEVFEQAGYSFVEKDRAFIKNDQRVEVNDIRNIINRQVFINSCDAEHVGGMYGKSLAGNYACFKEGKVSGSAAAIELNEKEKISNGYFYSSDVLLPDIGQTPLATILARGEYSEFKKLMDRSGYGVTQFVAEATSNENIIFIPSNEAIIAAGMPSSATFTTQEKVQVKKFIKNHIVPSDLLFTTSGFTTKILNTTQGESITLANSSSDKITITKGSVSTETVSDYSQVNVLASGGWVVHIIGDALID